jgi:ATP-dependent DNA ligase
VSDQLSLSLTGDVARLPRSLRPMLPKPADAAFDSDEHMFEPRWGGRRALAFIEPDGGRADPRLGCSTRTAATWRRICPSWPTLAEPRRRPAAILDGEIVMPDKAGRMDEEALVGAAGRRRQPPGSTPVYLAFDLLWAGGGRSSPSRCCAAASAWPRSSAQPELVVLPGVVRDGMDLYFAVAQQGLRGVMARHLRSPYLPGRAASCGAGSPTQPGEMPLHAVPDPVAEPPPGPVLALIQRLPLDD